MSIRVSSNQMVYSYQKQLNEANSRQDKLLEQGDGSKLHRPSDDSMAYSKYLRYDVSDAENGQYTSNVKNAISWMKTSDVALVNMTDIQTTFKEKTVAAANSTNNAQDMQAIGREMMAEIQELISLGNTMQGDSYVFGGTKDLTKPFSLSVEEVQRGLTKTLDDNQMAYFSGSNGLANGTGSSNLKQMLTLTGSDGNTYYFNTNDGYIYSQDFVETGYKDRVAGNANAVVDPTKDAVGKIDGWGGTNPTQKVSTYFKNTGEIKDPNASMTANGITFTFATIKQQIATYTGDNNAISMVKKNGSTEPSADTVNVTGADIFGSDIFDDVNSGNTASGTAMLNELLTVHAKVDAADYDWLTADGQTISDEAHSTTLNTQTKLGARQQLYTSVQTMLDNQSELITSDITDVSSTDVAALAVKLMQEQTIYNMSLSLGARILPQSLADYLS